jgi:hypothetical protein
MLALTLLILALAIVAVLRARRAEDESTLEPKGHSWSWPPKSTPVAHARFGRRGQ